MKVKEIEQNVVNQARFWTDFLDFISNLQSTIHYISDSRNDSEGKRLMDEGLSKLRQGAYVEMERALARCFAIAGIPGTDLAKEYSQGVAKRIFKFVDPRWLDQWHRMPSFWFEEDIKELRKDVMKSLDKEDSNQL